MAHLSPAQIATYTYQAGFRGTDFVRSIAVVLAESGGNTNARNTTGGNDSRGLMQINVGPRANPQYASRNLYDPAVNVATGKELQSSKGWTPWISSAGGQALYMPVAIQTAATFGPGIAGATAGQQAVQSGTGAIKDVAKSATSGLTDLGQAASKVGAWITTPSNWLRIIYVLVGGALAIGAILVIARPVAEPTIKIAKKAAVLAAA